jgi:uncharacterized protein YndB with AHSA1/START domain
MDTHIESCCELAVPPPQVFQALITPSSIRRWWSANRAIVYAADNGCWTAAWGDREDQPDYVCSYRISLCRPPHQLTLTDPVYFGRHGDMPDSLDNVQIEFDIQATTTGSQLRVRQSGLPAADHEFCQRCRDGWDQTLDQLQRLLGGAGAQAREDAKSGR